MKRFLLIPVAIVAVLAIWPSCISALAKDKQAITHEPRVIKLKTENTPQIIPFEASWNGAENAKSAENHAIMRANEWLKQNHRRVRLISHSISSTSTVETRKEGFYASGFHPVVTGSSGYFTVTILYVEK